MPIIDGTNNDNINENVNKNNDKNDKPNNYNEIIT